MKVEVVDAALTSELRRAVLRPQWPPGSRMHGDDDPDALHLAARDDAGRVVGACVLIPRPCPVRPDVPGAWQLRGMATVAEHRGEGIGTALTEAAADVVAHKGGPLIWCDARESAIAFYARLGFIGTGEVYAHQETGAPHLMMYRELSGDLGTSAH